MKHRSIGKMLLFYIVTLGLYRLYWLAKTRAELIAKTKLKIPSIVFLLIPYILVIVSVSMIVVSAASTTPIDDPSPRTVCTSTTMSVNRERCYEPASSSGDLGAVGAIGMILMYVSLIFIFPLMGWWYWQYAKAVELVTHEKLSFPIAMLIMLAVPDIFDILIIQDSFNKLGSKKTAAA